MDRQTAHIQTSPPTGAPGSPVCSDDSSRCTLTLLASTPTILRLNHRLSALNVPPNLWVASWGRLRSSCRRVEVCVLQRDGHPGGDARRTRLGISKTPPGGVPLGSKPRVVPVDRADLEGRTVDRHALRGAACVRYMRAGVPYPVIARLLGASLDAILKSYA